MMKKTKRTRQFPWSMGTSHKAKRLGNTTSRAKHYRRLMRLSKRGRN